MAVRRLETTCPDCGGGAEPAGTLTHRGGCDGSWHLPADRHTPLDPPPPPDEALPVPWVGAVLIGAVAGAGLLVLSWWWLALLLPCVALLTVWAVRP